MILEFTVYWPSCAYPGRSASANDGNGFKYLRHKSSFRAFYTYILIHKNTPKLNRGSGFHKAAPTRCY